MTSGQSKKIADRLDGMVSTLAGSRAALDDMTRARVAAKLQARLSSPRASRHRPWAIGAAVAAGVLIIVGAGAIMRGAVAIAPAVHDVEPVTADGELALTRQAGVLRGEVDGASLTLYGDGRATRHGHQIAIDAEAVVIDRSAAPADAPELRMTVRAVAVRIQHATFSVDSTPARVTVIRGELILQCPGDGEQTVLAGGSVTCGSRAGSAAPSNAAPGNAARVNAAPVNAAPVNAAPVNAAPSNAAPSNAAPVNAAPVNAAPSNAAPVNAAPSNAAPVNAAPSNAAPSIAVPPPRPKLAIAHAPEKRAPIDPSPVDDLASRYTAAEQLMPRDPRAARTALRALIDAAPTGEYAAPALLDLARLAHAARDFGAARAALDELATQPRATALAMPAAYLRCKLTANDADHRRCLAAFRLAFPHSPRDAEALAELAAAAGTAGDCAAARSLVDEYLHTYPAGASRAAMQAWAARCAP